MPKKKTRKKPAAGAAESAIQTRLERRVEEPRDELIGLKCSASEKAQIAALAEHAGLSVSDFIRVCINNWKKR